MDTILTSSADSSCMNGRRINYVYSTSLKHLNHWKELAKKCEIHITFGPSEIFSVPKLKCLVLVATTGAKASNLVNGNIFSLSACYQNQSEKPEQFVAELRTFITKSKQFPPAVKFLPVNFRSIPY